MINIIGAGPIGCYAGYLLAKAGKKVRIFEEHKEIGSPVQCTGLVTNSINKIIKLDQGVIVNKIKKARIYGGEDYFETNLSEFVLDRNRFDKSLAKKATKAGCRIFLNSKFIGINNKKIIIKNLKNKKLKKIDFNDGDLLIGADGPNSIVRHYVDKTKTQNWVGVQAIAKLRTSGDTFEVYLDKASGFFGWVVPESKNAVRIGLAAKDRPNYYFERLLKSKGVKKKDIIELQGGLIPRYNPKLKVQKDNLYLLGDAASQVKATTGGGIIPGLIAAKCLADSIIYRRDYGKLLKRRLSPSLSLHLKLRRVLDKFSQKDNNYLVKLCNQTKIKRILAKTDRENPMKLLFSLVVREPRFLLFLKNL
jgi:geranylgeranyl reductase family protein